MPALEILDHVVHQGINLKKGMIVDSQQNGLDEVPAGHTVSVAKNLVDRELAQFTDKAVTHSMALVNGAQEPLPVTAPAGTGQAPNAEADQARKAAAKENQQEATNDQKKQVEDEANKLDAPVVGNAPTAAQKAAPGVGEA